MSIRGRAIILPNYVPETDAIIIDCKSSVRHKVHKYVDSQIEPPLEPRRAQGRASLDPNENRLPQGTPDPLDDPSNPAADARELLAGAPAVEKPLPRKHQVLRPIPQPQMKITPAKPATTLRALPGLAAIAAAFYLSLPATVSAQATASAPASASAQANPTPATPSTESTVSPTPEVVLDPFSVTTSKDKGYAATNEISGSRVDTPIKDIPISIDVITSQFISDIGATDLRSALAYQAGIMTTTQNDLENTAGSISGQTYGPGGVNNPQGVTANPDQSQYKIRGFIATNTLRDGFLRLSGVDAVNIDRIEVVFGPNALLYGTGNFGGVVDYLPMRPMDTQSGYCPGFATEATTSNARSWTPPGRSAPRTTSTTGWTWPTRTRARRWITTTSSTIS